MAEEHCIGVNPDEALLEVCEKGHARHDIWGKIQKAEAEGIHDILEEIRERGTEPAREIVDEERVPIWGGPDTGRDNACGWMPHRFSLVFTPHRSL